jgi:predicted acyl esterase
MTRRFRPFIFVPLALVVFVFCSGPAKAQTLPSERPEKIEPTNYGFDYLRREVMIPMRDGVKLHTVILIPKGAKGAPILLTRTPYNATDLTTHIESSHLGPSLYGYDNATDVIVEGGYIRVVQDIRGKYGSEGDYVMNRPLQGPRSRTFRKATARSASWEFPTTASCH